MRLRQQSGSFLVEVIAASALLLTVLLSSTWWMGQITTQQVGTNRESAAVNQARLLLEREIAAAEEDSYEYLQLVQEQPELSGSVDMLPQGEYTLTRSMRDPTGRDPGNPTLFDVEVHVQWVPESGEPRTVRLFTSIWKR